MRSASEKIAAAPWREIGENMHEKGYALIPGVLTGDQCEELKRNYGRSVGYRKTVVMERHRFGLGEYKYFDYPLPEVVGEIRENVYPFLAPLANQWMVALNIDRRFPPTHPELLEQCRNNGQLNATPLILKYGQGGFNTLHQDLYGEVYFPFQAVLFLDEIGTDYSGGEFVMTEQIPRAQSKAIVLRPPKGDMLIFTTNFRPVKGSRGYYRAHMKHGVSEVHSGRRHTLGIIFHDAVS